MADTWDSWAQSGSVEDWNMLRQARTGWDRTLDPRGLLGFQDSGSVSLDSGPSRLWVSLDSGTGWDRLRQASRGWDRL